MSKKNNKEHSGDNKKRTRENEEIVSPVLVDPPVLVEKREFIKLSSKVETLDDLINLAKQYDSSKDYNINLKKLNKLLPSLEKLKGVIGMKSVKDSIVGQIVFFLNELPVPISVIDAINPDEVAKSNYAFL
jgi:hypothetical protein